MQAIHINTAAAMAGFDVSGQFHPVFALSGQPRVRSPSLFHRRVVLNYSFPTSPHTHCQGHGFRSYAPLFVLLLITVSYPPIPAAFTCVYLMNSAPSPCHIFHASYPCSFTVLLQHLINILSCSPLLSLHPSLPLPLVPHDVLSFLQCHHSSWCFHNSLRFCSCWAWFSAAKTAIHITGGMLVMEEYCELRVGC